MISSGSYPLTLTAGPVSVEFEPHTGWLRGVTCGDRVLVLSIYAAVRDENWGTILPDVELTSVEARSRSFEVAWKMTYPSLGFVFSGKCVGRESGEVTYSVTGLPTKPFLSKRSGVCLLHPNDQAGLPLLVNGEAGAFPTTIAPHEPYTNITEIEVTDLVRITFDGVIFEMEDQRNWCDASFKTYCRSNSWPSPYSVDEPFEHKVTIQPLGVESAAQHDRSSRQGAIPPLGIFLRPSGEAPPLKGPWFVDLVEDDWSHEELEKLPPSEEITAFWQPGRPSCSAGIVAVANPKHFEEARSTFPQSKVFLAGRHNFVDLNRMSPKPQDFDGLIFGLWPQTHSVDDRSILENLRAIPDLVASAKAIAGGRPVFVGPLAFSRFPTPNDLRYHNSLVGKAWKLGAFLTLASCGVDQIIAWDAGELIYDRLEWAERVKGWEGATVQCLPTENPWHVLHFSIEAEGKSSEVYINLREKPVEAEGVILGPYEVRSLGELEGCSS